MVKREQFLTDILITAVEGGINYWAAISNYHHSDNPPAASAVVYDTENCNKCYGLTLDVVRKGLEIIIAPGFQLRQDILSNILLANRSNGDLGDIDSEAADCIVQAGLFGEVIYG